MRSKAPVPTRSHGDLAGTVVYARIRIPAEPSGGDHSPEDLTN